MHMLSKKDLSSAELETIQRSRNPTTGITANGEVPTKLGSKHAINFSKGTLAPYKNSGKKGSIARNYSNVFTS